METAEVLSGVFLLMIGILAAAPLPLDGWFYEEFLEFAVLGLICGVIMILLGSYLTISGLKSKNKSRRIDTIGASCLLLSFITLLTAFINEGGIWAWSLTITGVSLLILGVVAVLVSERRTAKKQTE